MDKIQIEKEARRVQVEIWTQRDRLFSMGAPPVPALFEPRVVAGYYGLEFEARDQLPSGRGPGFEAAGVLDRQREWLAISLRFPYVTQRFTAAHELGHFVLHPWIGDRVMHRDRPMDGSPQEWRPQAEKEADHFGACLLMPRRAVETEFNRRFGTRRPLALTEAVAFHLGVVDPGPLFAAPAGSLDFARTVARATKFDRSRFQSLAEFFGVSITAMAIRLVELDLVAAYLHA